MPIPFVEIRGLTTSLFRAAARDPAAVEKEREAIKSRYRVAFLWQLFLYFLVVVTIPGYILPFMHHPQAFLWVSATLCIEAFAILLHLNLAPISKSNRVACYVSSSICGFVPACLLPILGPAIVTITNSLSSGCCS